MIGLPAQEARLLKTFEGALLLGPQTFGSSQELSRTQSKSVIALVQGLESGFSAYTNKDLM